MLNRIYSSMGNFNAQMHKLDVSGNNIVNSNTAGFKRQSVSFIDFMNLQPQQGDGPVRDSKGSASTFAVTDRNLGQSNLIYTGRQLDLGIEGNGLFRITREDGAVFYTRDGSFQIDADGRITSEHGYILMDEELPENYSKITINETGIVSCDDENGDVLEIGQIELAYFSNPAGLDAVGDNLYVAADAAGEPQMMIPGEDMTGIVKQGQVESSNVELVMEMKNMIEAQRSIQFDGKIIQTADQFWNIANNLQK